MEIYFWFRKSSKDNEMGTISCVLRIDGIESIPFSTKIKTERKHWNSKEQSFEGKGSSIKEADKERLVNRLRQILQSLISEKNGEQVYPDDVRNMHLQKIKVEQEIIVSQREVLTAYITNAKKLVVKGKLEESTLRTYSVRENVLLAFLKYKKNINLPCVKFDENIADELQEFLIENGKKQSYINQIVIFLKSTQKFAYKKKMITTNPLELYELESVKYSLPVILEQYEIDEMINVSAKDEQLMKICDAFLFCSETSLAFIDYFNLKNDMLVMYNDRPWIEKMRKKTGELQIIPLSDRALAILAKYNNNLEELPKTNYFSMRYLLGKIKKLANITKKLTWHTSRKTWANNSLNNLGMRESTIAAVMGWSSTQQLKRYARIAKKTIEKEYFKK